MSGFFFFFFFLFSDLFDMWGLADIILHHQISQIHTDELQSGVWVDKIQIKPHRVVERDEAVAGVPAL